MREEYEIIVNGDSKTIPVFTLTYGHHITYSFVANLCGYGFRDVQPDVIYTYPGSTNYPKAGELHPGETIRLEDGMSFDVVITDRS